MTYTCQKCGKVFFTERELAGHVCSGSKQYKKTCWKCGGAKRISSGILGTSEKCPICHGNGYTVESY